MVIAGASEPSPVRAAAWSAVVAQPQSGPGKATMPTEPPVPPAPTPSTIVAEKTLPHAPADPLAMAGAGPSVPAAAPSAPPAAPVPLALFVEPLVPAPAGGVADPPVLVPGAPVAPPASVPDAPVPASVSSIKAASATTGGPAPSVAPSAAGQSAPAVAPMAPAGQPSRLPSPDRRPSRPHPPSPHQDRKSSRPRRDSPRQYQQQPHWPAHPGGQGDWRGPRGRGGGGGYRPPVTMADLQREVSRAVHIPTAPAPAASAPASGARLRLPLVPPVAGVEFAPAGGGAFATQYSHPADEDQPLLFLAEALQPPQTRVPEATLGQLHRLAESLHALLLIQVVAHSSLPVIPPESFRGRQRDTCLDAADQLAVLLAPVLAAPAEGGAAAAGQLDEAVRGLRRHLRAGSGAAAIGASTLVVWELWRSLTGVLHALGAHRM
ncbi:unnamed protein product [Closterium sp. Naga37s-1]|nr:unnamed protein product [Closterium sp. Naga37s-1]